ncbi:MAG: four helix bundle protein [bacterium]
MLNLNHKKLEVWKMSVSFVSMIYELTDQFPKSEIYGITNQLRRAAVSVPSNIAEGASRTSLKDRKRFYEIARSSLVEIDTQLEISLALEFFGKKSTVQTTELFKTINSLFAMLSKLIEKTK